MKVLLVVCACLIGFTSNSIQKAPNSVDLQVLVGQWKLDLSPQDQTDDNFAIMHVTEVSAKSFKGEFYRKGVKIKNAQINTQLGILYGSLISGDNSGIYNTTFYYKEGRLHGSTHAVDKQFLAVWIATKIN